MAASARGTGNGDPGGPRARLEWGLYALLLGLGPALLYCLQFSPLVFLSAFAVSALVAGASFATGFLLGFLFGIPRTVERPGANEPPVGQDRMTRSDGGETLPVYLANTNLGQVSDWLTKILVGVGLTQIRQIGRQAQNLLDYLAPALGDAPSSRSFALALLLFYLGGGFLLGYLWTSIHLPSVLRWRDVVAWMRESQAVRRDVAAYPGKTTNEVGDTEGELEEPPLEDPAAKAQVAEVAGRVKSLEMAGGGLGDAEKYLRLARQLKRAGELEEAERAYLRAFELNPSDPSPLNFAGVIRSKYFEDYAAAARLYARALEVDPNYVSAIYNSACNEIRRNNYSAGLRLLAEAIDKDPDRYRALARRDAGPGGPFERVADQASFRELVGDAERR